MTRRYITLREVEQADAWYRQRCLPVPAPGDRPGRGPGLSRASACARAGHAAAPGLDSRAPPVLPVALACGGRRAPQAPAPRRPRRAAHGPMQLLCWRATRLPPGGSPAAGAPGELGAERACQRVQGLVGAGDSAVAQRPP
jgi:hypothetical protein